MSVRLLSRRLWGCYSVADHIEPRAFVADLLLYDRLVVPVPMSDDRARWERNGWYPERQDRLLAILGDFVERVEWTPALREQFERDYVDDSSPYAATRQIISAGLGAAVAGERDVRAVAVYAAPDRFDRDWKLTRTMPFLKRTTSVQKGELREGGPPADPKLQGLAKLVVTRLVVPDDGQSDEEVLKRTVELVSRDDVAERRAAFQQLVASLDELGIREDLTIVGEVEDQLKALNKAVRQRTFAQRARVAVQVFKGLEGAAALIAPPVAAATGPIAALGEAQIERRWSESEPLTKFGAVSLLADAQRALAG